MCERELSDWAAGFSPLGWNARLAPIGPGELPTHGSRGVRIVAQVHCPQDGLAEVVGMVKCP